MPQLFSWSQSSHRSGRAMPWQRSVRPPPSVAGPMATLAPPRHHAALLRAALVLGALFLLTLLPYLIALHGQRDGSYFLGSLRPSSDEAQYLTAIREGEMGTLLWHDQYTVVPPSPSPILMYPVYTVAGHLGMLAHLDARWVFILLHPLSVLILFGAVWRLAALFLRPGRRGWFLAFAFGTSSLYWLDALLAIFGDPPVALTRMGMQHVSGFSLGLIVSHEALGIAGQVAALTALLAALSVTRHRAARWRLLPYGMGGTLLVALAAPFFLPMTLALLALTSCLWIACSPRSTRVARALLAVPITSLLALPALPFTAYYLWLFHQPMYRQFNGTGPLAPIEGFLTWGALLPLAVWGWRCAMPEGRPLAEALALWCGFVAICTWPNLLQGSRYPTGVNLAIGALVGLGVIGSGIATRWRVRLLLALGLGLICQYLFLFGTLAGGSAPHLYLSPSQAGAVDWLAAHAGPDDVVLAPFTLGNVLPGFCRCRVVVGEYSQTYDFRFRFDQMQAFFDPASSAATRRALLRATRATYVVWDPVGSLNGQFDPRGMPGLRLVFDSQAAAVLQAHQ